MLRAKLPWVTEGSDDVGLAQRWQAGDEAAGQQLFERHYARLARFFRSKLAHGSADLVQRTFLAVVEGREQLRDPADFRRWLFSIAYRQLFRHLRQRHRAVTRDALGSMSAADLGPSPASLAGRREQARILLTALRSLPLELQIAFELYCWEGLTLQQIADVLEVPLGTAKTRLRQARLRLQEAVAAQPGTAAAIESSLADLDRWALHVRDGLAEGSESA